MKKSNVILAVLFTLASVFLLWLWYYLGLNHVDEPLDLILSIIWWVMIIAVIVTITRVEKHRKERIRTVYVSEDEIFNSEAGRLAVSEPDQLVETVSDVLEGLKYNFSKNDLPEKENFKPRFLIRTSKIKDNDWEGEVVNTWTKRQIKFNNRDELARILTAQGA